VVSVCDLIFTCVLTRGFSQSIIFKVIWFVTNYTSALAVHSYNSEQYRFSARTSKIYTNRATAKFVTPQIELSDPDSG